jgi:hypothetical protein
MRRDGHGEQGGIGAAVGSREGKSFIMSPEFGLFHDLRHSQPVPSKAEFMSRLKTRVTKELHVKLKMEVS